MEQTLTERQDYETPPDLFAALEAEFGPFDIDVAAHVHNWKVARYWDVQTDGLGQDWSGLKCWMNPPYGRGIGAWVQKACEAQALTVALLPARTDTKWFHDFIQGRAKHIRFLKGRPKFWLDRKPTGSGGKFPSMVVVWDNRPPHLMLSGRPPICDRACWCQRSFANQGGEPRAD